MFQSHQVDHDRKPPANENPFFDSPRRDSRILFIFMGQFNCLVSRILSAPSASLYKLEHNSDIFLGITVG